MLKNADDLFYARGYSRVSKQQLLQAVCLRSKKVFNVGVKIFSLKNGWLSI